ncbi:MAG TPA: hypothetical protein VF793_23380 [Telluria sp.]
MRGFDARADDGGLGHDGRAQGGEFAQERLGMRRIVTHDVLCQDALLVQMGPIASLAADASLAHSRNWCPVLEPTGLSCRDAVSAQRAIRS